MLSSLLRKSFHSLPHTEGKTATMEPNCKYFRNPMVWLLALVWTVTWAFSFTEGTAKFIVRGEIGGNVTINCPVDKQRKLNFFYLQRGNDFVNGFHTRNIPEDAKTWENTRVDVTETAVHMYGLNFSHSGDYMWYFKYVTGEISTVPVHLLITANYSKPTVTIFCPDGFGCTVTCTSHGGYPLTRMMWDVPVSGNTSSQMWNVMNTSEDRSPVTMMFTSSSTAYFNCSKGEIKFLGCSVGDITSDRFSVCTTQPPPVIFNLYVVAAAVVICAVVVFTVITMLLRWRCKCKTRTTGTATWNSNGCGEEITVLNRTEAAEAS